MKASELRAKDAAELGKELESLLKAQFGLRMQKATQQLANTSQIRKVRRDIARVRTLLTEKAEKSEKILEYFLKIVGWQSRQQQDGQNGRRSGRTPHQAPHLRQNCHALQQVQGTRRSQSVQRRRYR